MGRLRPIEKGRSGATFYKQCPTRRLSPALILMA